jgi:hypothetical protein
MTKNHSLNIFNFLSDNIIYTLCQNNERSIISYYSERRKINLLNMRRALTKFIAFIFHQKIELSKLVRLDLHHLKSNVGLYGRVVRRAIA